MSSKKSAPSKPRIWVLSADDDDKFDWLSDGWYQTGVKHTAKAQRLMRKAATCINLGKDVPDVIRRLKKAGFEVVPFKPV